MWLPFVNSANGRPDSRIASMNLARSGQRTHLGARAVDERAVDVEDEAADVVQPHWSSAHERYPVERRSLKTTTLRPCRSCFA